MRARVIQNDEQIQRILKARSPRLPELVVQILEQNKALPPWTSAIISGGGWNADRGNWTIVDSAMCNVDYGRYNVTALIDAFRLAPNGQLVLQENRLDALTHFFVARDSMYRQIYQHRVLQTVDRMTVTVVQRIKDLLENDGAFKENLQPAENEVAKVLKRHDVFCDDTMRAVLCCLSYTTDLNLAVVYQMTEHWWYYHLAQWTHSGDEILADLASRLLERRLFKTVRLYESGNKVQESDSLIEKAKEVSTNLGFDPRYYVHTVRNSDAHRLKIEESPLVLLDNGETVPVITVEPLISELFQRSPEPRVWLAVPQEVKEQLGRYR